MKCHKGGWLFLLVIIYQFFCLNLVQAQGTAFTYQGRLNDASGPANGKFDFKFALYATNADGVCLAGPVTNSTVAVSNGLFLAAIDFGSIFNGSNYWLEVAVRTNGAASFTGLAPRQVITPSPSALFALTAGTLTGIVPLGQIDTNALNALVAAQATQTFGTSSIPALAATNLTNIVLGVAASSSLLNNSSGTLNSVISSNPPVMGNDILEFTNQSLSAASIGGIVSCVAAQSNAVVMIMGDSYTDGTGIENSGQGAGMSTSWVFGSLLRNAYGDDGAAGTCNGAGYGWGNSTAHIFTSFSTAIWPLGNSLCLMTTNATNNLMWTGQNPGYGNGISAMPTNFVNLAGMCYITTPTGGSNNITIWSLNSRYTNTFGISTYGMATNFIRTNWPVPLASDYTMVITNLSGTNILFCPLFLSTNRGVQYVQFGFGGKCLDQYLTGWSNLWVQIFAAFNPDVFIFNNIHWPYSYDVNGSTSMAWSNQMAALSTMLPAKTKITLVGQPPNVANPMLVLNYQYRLLCQAQSWSYADLWSQFPSYTNSFNLGLFESDGVHPNTAGMMARASALYKAMNFGNAFPVTVDLRNISGIASLTNSYVPTNSSAAITARSFAGLFIGNGVNLTNVPYAALTGAPVLGNVAVLSSNDVVNMASNAFATSPYYSTNLSVISSLVATQVVQQISTSALPAGNITGVINASNLPVQAINSQALAFAQANNIIDQKAIQDLSGYYAYLNRQAIASNLVDALALRKRWHSEASKTSIKGNPFIWANPSYDAGGFAQINATSTVSFTLPAGISNFTAVLVFHRLQMGSAKNMSGVLLRFLDTNTTSSVYWSELSGQFWTMENNGQNYYPILNYQLAVSGTNYGTNTMWPGWIDGYADRGRAGTRDNPRMCERFALTVVHMANGTQFSYIDGLTNCYNYWPTFGTNFNYSSPTVSPVPFNTLTLGIEPTNASQKANYYGGANAVTNFAVSSIQIFNSTNLSQVWPETEASWWFEDEDYYDQFVGDSRSQPTALPVINSYPYFYEYKRSGGAYWNYDNYSEGMTTAQQFGKSWATIGGLGTITNLPFEKIKQVNLFYRFGDNDINFGASLSQTYQYITNGLAPLIGYPVSISFMDTWQFSTNVASYNYACESNRIVLNALMATNQPIFPAKEISVNQYITQQLLDTNSGYTADGIHFNSTNTAVYEAIAQYMLAGNWPQWLATTGLSNANGANLTNIAYSSITGVPLLGTVTVLSSNDVINMASNAVVSSPYFSTNQFNSNNLSALISLVATQAIQQVSTSSIFGMVATNPSPAFTLTLYAESDAYLATNSIGNPLARDRLHGYEQEKKNFGIWTNFVDAVIEKPGFIGSNNISFFGRPLVLNNTVIATTNWGAWFNGSNSSIVLNGLGGFGLRTNTIAIVMKNDITNLDNQYFTGGLMNTNTGSTTFFDSGWTANPNNRTYLLYQRSGWNMTNTWQQFIWSIGAGGYSYGDPMLGCDRRVVWIISSDGNGNMRCWKDGVPCQLGYPSSAPVYNSPYTNTDDLNALYLGKDMTNPSSLYIPFNGQIDVAEVYNCAASSNLVRGIMMSTRWLEPEVEDDYFIGDSRTSPLWYQQQNAPYSDWPHFLMKSKPNSFTYQNLGIGGSKWVDWNNPTNSGTNYLLPAPDFVTKRVVYEALGINDIYANGTHGDTLWLYRSNWIAHFKAAGFVYYPVLLWGIATNSNSGNSYQYNPVNEGYVSTFGSLTISNAFMVDGIVRADLLNLPGLLSVTNGNAPYSVEGLHFNNTNGYYGNQLIAEEANNPAHLSGANQYGVNVFNTAVAMPSLTVSGTITGSGAYLTNLTAANLNGTIPQSTLPSGVLTNGYMASAYFGGGLTVTGNIVGTFIGNGAGLTNLNAANLTGFQPVTNNSSGTTLNNLNINGGGNYHATTWSLPDLTNGMNTGDFKIVSSNGQALVSIWMTNGVPILKQLAP